MLCVLVRLCSQHGMKFMTAQKLFLLHILKCDVRCSELEHCRFCNESDALIYDSFILFGLLYIYMIQALFCFYVTFHGQFELKNHDKDDILLRIQVKK